MVECRLWECADARAGVAISVAACGSGGVRGFINLGDTTGLTKGDNRGENSERGDSTILLIVDTDGEPPSLLDPGLRVGEKRNGFQGDTGDGVSGSQYETAGTGGTSISTDGPVDSDEVPGWGYVERRGVGGRAGRHVEVEHMRSMDSWREFTRGRASGMRGVALQSFW